MRTAALVCLLAAACVTPRSAVLGQTAAPVGQGGTEVGLAIGASYQSQFAPPQGATLPSQAQTRAFAFPAFEANGQIGIADRVSVNLHAGPAGLQPGAKLTLLDGRFKLAVLPQVALGYSSQGQSTFTTQNTGQQQENNPSLTTALSLMGGLRVIASHRVGVYGGVGYDFQSVTGVQSTTNGVAGAAAPVETTYATVAHNVTAAIGFDADLGRGAHMRPELALVFTPAIFQSFSSRGATTDAGGGYGVLIMPTLTFSAGQVVPPRRGEGPPPETDTGSESGDGDNPIDE